MRTTDRICLNWFLRSARGVEVSGVTTLLCFTMWMVSEFLFDGALFIFLVLFGLQLLAYLHAVRDRVVLRLVEGGALPVEKPRS